MQTSQCSGIATWGEPEIRQQSTEYSDLISTEPEVNDDEKWQECIDSLIAVAQAVADEQLDADPSQEAIAAACDWLLYFRNKLEFAAPTCIVREPAGGIMIEWRHVDISGSACITELTTYNDRHAELATFQNRRVIGLFEIPFVPTKINTTHQCSTTK